MKISARPCSRCRSRSRLRYCAWIVRSRLVVGSSAINRRGSQEMPIAPTMRWRMPPDISCGYCVTRVSGDGMRTAFNSSHARLQAVAREAPSCTRIGSPTWSPIVNSGFSDAIGSCRIIAIRLPRTWRISASDFLHEVLALEQHLPADDPRRRRQDAQDGQRQRALARARLADDAQGLAGVDATATPHRPHARRASPAPRRNGSRGSAARAAGRFRRRPLRGRFIAGGAGGRA